MNNRKRYTIFSPFRLIKTLIPSFKLSRPPKPYKSRYYKDARNTREWERQRRQDKRMYAINALLMLLTLVIAGVSVYQGWLSRQQFLISTTPYLQINKVALTVKPGASPMITFEIENLTKVPTKIVYADLGDSVSGQIRTYARSQLTGALYNPFTSNGALLNTRGPDQGNNRYAIEGSPYQDVYTAGYILDSAAYNDIMTGKSAFYFYGQVAYINQAKNDENRAYLFAIKVTETPAYRVETITNGNYYSENAP